MSHAPESDSQDPRTPSAGSWPGRPTPGEPEASATSWYSDTAPAYDDPAQRPSYEAPAGQVSGHGSAAGLGHDPYGQDPYAPYPAAGYGAAAPAEESGTGLSIASMVLGILSVIGGFSLVVLPIVGVVLGHMGLKREPRGRGFAIAGLVTNYVALLLLVLAIGLIVLLALIGMASSEPYGTYS
ncbi:DUF4190 domain-containing protein [Micrococcus sp.]|uniref:DUF4190 domain-containing protein n=1 Tax=Micrococcus sp. TaxID=1271 RepID=UPI002A91DF5E|nr:DUF4190 domain-containing protein [Micrococcus sp.]MDY6054674.1 DUF4190 domain-containing protein [Micrococcus sp.]